MVNLMVGLSTATPPDFVAVTLSQTPEGAARVPAITAMEVVVGEAEAVSINSQNW